MSAATEDTLDSSSRLWYVEYGCNLAIAIIHNTDDSVVIAFHKLQGNATLVTR